MTAKCKKIQKMLPSFVGNELTPEIAKGVANHLAECVECRTVANEYHRSIRLVKYALGKDAVLSELSNSPCNRNPDALSSDFFGDMRESVSRKIAKGEVWDGERHNIYSPNVFFKVAAAILIFLFGTIIGSNFHLTSLLYPVAARLSGSPNVGDQNEKYYNGELSRSPHTAKELADLHLTLGEIYIRNCRYDDAIREAKLALLSDPTREAAHNIVGAAYAKQNRYFEALGEFERAVSMNPHYAAAYYNLGVVFGVLGRRDQAQDAFRNALKSNRELTPAYYRLGLLAEKAAQYEDAVRYYEKALQLNPENPIVINRVGVMRMNIEGKITDAIDAFKRAIALNPQDQYPCGDSAHYNLGKAFDRLHRQNEAIAEFKLAIKLNPDFAPAYYSLGLLLIKQKRFAEGKEYMETFRKLRNVALAQLEAENRYRAAIQRMRKGQYEEANRKLKEVIKILPGYSYGQSLLEHTPGYELPCTPLPST